MKKLTHLPAGKAGRHGDTPSCRQGRELHGGLCFLIFILLIIYSFPSQAQEKTSSSGIAVIELFTSQGDINSPPADKLLSEIIADASKKNLPVYCLSMHVDFWNRYGWKDPFSALKYTKRLMNYTSVMGMKETYTPFMILNGRTVLPVNDSKKTNETVSSVLQKKAMFHPEFTYQVFDDTLDISYQLNASGTSKKLNTLYLNIAIVEAGLITPVTKGDNEGKTLRNDNVTRLFFSADVNSQKGLARVPLKKLKPGPSRSVILFLQDKTSREVVGATSVPFR